MEHNLPVLLSGQITLVKFELLSTVQFPLMNVTLCEKSLLPALYWMKFSIVEMCWLGSIEKIILLLSIV